jgi:hypothetical protein
MNWQAVNLDFALARAARGSAATDFQSGQVQEAGISTTPQSNSIPLF